LREPQIWVVCAEMSLLQWRLAWPSAQLPREVNAFARLIGP